MKKLIGLLALLALVPSAQAGDFSHAAEFRLRYQVDQDSDGNSDNAKSSTNAWGQRFKWGSTFRSGEKLTAQLTLLHNATWGHSGLYQPAASVETGDTALGLMDGTDNGENMLLVNEAYGSWMATDEMLVRFGRGALTMADGRVIGANDWESTPYAFEGALFTWDKEFARFNVYGVKFAELTGTAVSDPEINSYGFNMDWKNLPEFLKMVNVHVIQVNVDDDTTATGSPVGYVPQENRMRYGITVAGDTMNIDYRLTYAAHSGEFDSVGALGKRDRDGSMIDFEVGYAMPEVKNSRVSFAYHSDTGTSVAAATASKAETYDGYFYEKHDNAGWMDIFAFGNLTFMQARYTMDIMDDLSLGLQYIMFSQTEKDGEVKAGANGSTWAGTTGAGNNTEDGLGTEIDLALTKKYEGGLMITARYGMFTPGDEYKNGAEDTYNQIFFEGKMSF